MSEKKRVLILVKTYPNPSRKYLETVCTAGILEDGSLIRLYPIDFRYRPIWQWYKKYQWIDVEVVKHDGDKRKESYRPILDSIVLRGAALSTGPGRSWGERRALVLKRPPTSMEELRDLQELDGTSLGIVKPKKVIDVTVEPDGDKWSATELAKLMQSNMFTADRKPLEKIPFKFSYRFVCDDPRCTGHKMKIEDWEVGELYLKEVERRGDRVAAAESVRKKFLDVLCGPDRDTHFFVGTVLSHGTWIVLGVFWPPKKTTSASEGQLSLPFDL